MKLYNEQNEPFFELNLKTEFCGSRIKKSASLFSFVYLDVFEPNFFPVFVDYKKYRI